MTEKNWKNAKYEIQGMQVRGSSSTLSSYLYINKGLNIYTCVCTFVCIRISFYLFSRSFLFTDFDIIYHHLLSFFSCHLCLSVNLLPSSFRSRRFFWAHRLSLSLSFSRSQSFSVIPLSFILKHCYIFIDLSACVHMYIYRERE